MNPEALVRHRATKRLEDRIDAVEHDLATLQSELNETQERLDFAERLLSQAKEAKRLGSAE